MLIPLITASGWPNALRYLAEPHVPIEHNVRVIGQEPTADPSQLGRGILNRYMLLVGVLYISQVTHQVFCILAGNRYPTTRQAHYLIGGRNHGLRHNDFVPTPVAFVGQLYLLLPSLQVLQPLNGQDWMVAGQNVRVSRGGIPKKYPSLAGNPLLTLHPVIGSIKISPLLQRAGLVFLIPFPAPHLPLHTFIGLDQFLELLFHPQLSGPVLQRQQQP